MKKIIFLLCLFVISLVVVRAESFVEGSFISGEYISKKKDGAIHYLTVQYLKDSKGNIVYCLEPYTKFAEGKSYTSYTGDLGGYNSLSNAKKRKISLIIYYGYGYTGRTSSKWYAITQFLIWDTITDSDGSIYFTDTLNGKKITKYSSEINEVLTDVKNHDTKPSYISDNTINYGEGLYYSKITKDTYEIKKSTYKYTLDKALIIDDVKENGYFELSKLSNFYKDKVAIFDSTNSQDLIRPGNVVNPTYRVNITVLKGNIVLDIKKDESVYTVESDFTNTCYDIFWNGTHLVDTVCTGSDELVYESVDLAYGEYVIKQKSVGVGYKIDENIYKVVIDKNNQKPNVTLYNYLLKNKVEIKKRACIKDNCQAEKDAVFELIDKNGNSVGKLITDADGYTSYTLGYGSYSINQLKGLDEYTLADSYNERIIDEDSNHLQELFNYKIEKKEKPTPKVVETPKEDDEEEVPDTKTDNWFIVFITSIVDTVKGFFVKMTIS